MVTTDEQDRSYVDRGAAGKHRHPHPILLAVVAVLAALGLLGLAGCSSDSKQSGEVKTFVVPKGTAEKIYEGQVVDLMPSEVKLKVGDSLVIRNDDVETVTVGPFTVRAGETLTQKFQRPQTLIGECALSGSGDIKIVVA